MPICFAYVAASIAKAVSGGKPAGGRTAISSCASARRRMSSKYASTSAAQRNGPTSSAARPDSETGTNSGHLAEHVHDALGGEPGVRRGEVVVEADGHNRQ